MNRSFRSKKSYSKFTVRWKSSFSRNGTKKWEILELSWDKPGTGQGKSFDHSKVSFFLYLVWFPFYSLKILRIFWEWLESEWLEYFKGRAVEKCFQKSNQILKTQRTEDWTLVTTKTVDNKENKPAWFFFTTLLVCYQPTQQLNFPVTNANLNIINNRLLWWTRSISFNWINRGSLKAYHWLTQP